MDEAGRGPLAGSLSSLRRSFSLSIATSAAWTIPRRLTPEFRADLFMQIANATHVHWAVSVQDVVTIDTINILRATHRAMSQAISALPSSPEHVLIDGLP